MLFRQYPIAIGATLVILQPSLVVAQDISAVNNTAKNITAKIISQQGNGSGVIYSRTGNTYSVVTNQHVVAEDGSYQIQTRDGTQHQLIKKQEIAGLDLAIVQFESTQSYELANFGNSNEITEQQNISVAGFPGGQTDIDIVNGSIRSIKQGVIKNPEAEQGYALVYTNQVLPGSSGGAVLDQQGNVIAINGQGTRDITTGRDISRGIPINLFLTAINFSSSNYKLVYTIPDAFADDSSNGSFFGAHLFESAETDESAETNLFEFAVNKVAIGENKIVSNSGNTVKVWNLATGELEKTLTGHSKLVNNIAVNTNHIVSNSYDNTIKVWNLATGFPERTIKLSGAMKKLAISEDKIVTALDAGNKIEVRNIATEQLERTVNPPNSSSSGFFSFFKSIAVSEDKIAGAFSDADTTIMVWNLATGVLEHTFPDNKASYIAIGDGKIVSSGYSYKDKKTVEDNTIRVWNIATGELEHTLTGHTDKVNSLTINDGKVISGSKDKTIKVWSLATGKLEKTLTGHTDSVTSVAVDGDTIVSASDDDSIKVWRSQN